MKRVLNAILISILGVSSVPPAFAAAGVTTPDMVPAKPARATLPMTFEQHRPYADLTLAGPDGQPVRARVWLDTGGGAIVLSAPLAQRLGLKPAGRGMRAEGMHLAMTSLPQVRAGDMPLHLDGARALIALGSGDTLQGTQAQAAFPVRVLRNYEVVLDYPQHRLTIAAPGTLRHHGRPVPAHFGAPGFIGVTLKVDGKPHGFLLDSGGQYCMITQDALARWLRRHPHWPHVKGAYGPADMMLGAIEADFRMVRIPRMQWGPFALRDVGSVSRPVGNYERMMSKLVGAPVIGSIGGNVLKDFRVDIDYPHRTLYLQRDARRRPVHVDMVGITLERRDGHYVVAGIAPGQDGLQPGDRLLRVGHLAADNATDARLMQALSGRPGARRRLVVERDGRQIAVQATVRHVF